MEVQLDHLTEIQTIDNKISEVLDKKETFPKLIKELKDKLKAGQEEIDNLNATLAENASERKKHQSQIDVDNDRIERVEGKLPQIKTNKEYQALVKETDTMKKEISMCEDTILTLLEEEETLDKELTEKSEAFKSEEQDSTAKIAEYEKEIGKFDNEISEFESDKTIHLRDVDDTHISAYERIKSRRDGIAIVAALGGVCQGCYMNLPPQLFIMIQRSDDIHLCPNCSRILYFKES